MEIVAGKLPGVHVIDAPKRGDERGYLVRTYCEDHFRNAGLNTHWVQCSLTHTAREGTLRGMHFQTSPFGEIKLIRCVSGSVWDCVVDLRPTSPCFGQWEAYELSEANERSLYVPEGVAHGFYSLTDDVRMLYQMSAPYSPEHASGVRWDDAELSIDWPRPPRLVSEKDLALPWFQKR
ncbi:dTDP-4-dehydrorhamnose 3,5-epimerase [Luteolibacter sp. LG18]|uniref:dTDP-4-dehydrorhamnose 3,5-epimerase n=1 Tax=Luteolibacter sp. LG18 TaxID=2819286 RepID=UPI002B31A0AF|nr:dTDP-4-dehydrorhamnose 3,5-epimerase [Luteolibacter sp. LG18]